MCQINTCLMDSAVKSEKQNLSHGGECAGRHKGWSEDKNWKKIGRIWEISSERSSNLPKMFTFLSPSEYSAPDPHLHESWLLSSSVNGEMKDGMPVSLPTYYKSCWEIWSTFFSGCPPGTHILHLLHLFMTVLWPQTYAMAKSHFESRWAA